MNIMKYFKPATLFVFFLIISVFFVSKTFFPPKASAITLFGIVLGDDDEKEDEKDEDEKNEEDEKDEEEKEREEEKSEEKKETRTTTINSNGTRTVVKTKVEDNGKMEIESKTYDINGKVMDEQKIKSGDDETEVEYKGISEVKFKSKDGEEFKLMIKNDDKSLTKVRYDSEHNYIRIVGKPSDDNDDVLIKDSGDDEYEIEQNGESARVSLPLTVNDNDGSVSVLTGDGEKILKYFPSDIVEIAKSDDDSTEISDVNVKEKDGKVIYELTTEKAQMILGLFKTNIESLKSYDAETGTELESQQSFWNKIIDVISF